VLCDDAGSQATHLIRIGQVGANVLHPICCTLCQSPRYPNHVGTFGCQRFRHGGTNAARGAGNKRYPARKAAHSE
jgi:hypothetical protein